MSTAEERRRELTLKYPSMTVNRGNSDGSTKNEGINQTYKKMTLNEVNKPRVSGSTEGMSVDLRVSDQPWFKSLAPNLHDSPANVETTIRLLNFI